MNGGSRMCILINPSLRSSLLLFLSAIYLCKRTMQNKTRLELADYEAVSAADSSSKLLLLSIDLCVKLAGKKNTTS